MIESFDYCEFFGDVKIELHAEVIDEIELKADQTFNIVFFKLAGCYTSLIEAEDMFDFLILEDLSDFQWIWQSDANDVDMQAMFGMELE